MKTIDVWRASLDRSAEETANLLTLLSATEQDRASRFHREIDRSRYITGRATLRILIGDYIGTPADLVPLGVLPSGKPSIDARANSQRLHFNLSHTESDAVFAFSAKPIGIDIQKMEGFAEAHRVAAHFFAPAEAATFDRIDATERERYFFRTWVRKEAYLKATGQALAVDPSKVYVEDSIGGCTEITDPDGSTHIDRRFMVYDLTGAPGNVAAIAIEASLCPPAIHIREWSHRDNISLAQAEEVSARV